MAIPDEAIEEFRQIYFNQYGKELSVEDLREQVEKLVHLVLLIYKPMALEDYDAIQKKRLEELPDIIRMIAADPD